MYKRQVGCVWGRCAECEWRGWWKRPKTLQGTPFCPDCQGGLDPDPEGLAGLPHFKSAIRGAGWKVVEDSGQCALVTIPTFNGPYRQQGSPVLVVVMDVARLAPYGRRKSDAGDE